MLSKQATELVERCVVGLKGKRDVTFLTGNAGPLALGAVMHYTNGDKEEAQNMITKFVLIFQMDKIIIMKNIV